MKSNKQRRREILEKRRKRAQRSTREATIEVDRFLAPRFWPKRAVRANREKLRHNNTYGLLPYFYLDRDFDCIDCGSKQRWTADQQKWWYEEAKGSIDSRAVRCFPCRKHIQALKEAQRRHMENVANRAPHPHEAFFKNKKRC